MNQLFTEKYRPQSLNEIALPARVKNFLADGIVTNMLFYGAQGSGKTSTAKLLINQCGNDYKYINCSSESGIDVIRETITDFCETQSLVGSDKLKVVLLDEFDGMSINSYQALRGCIEKYAANTRFVATCNFINKVPAPIQSRFTLVDFNFTDDELLDVKKQMCLRVMYICGQEGMTIEKDAMAYLVKHNYPDCRKIVSSLEVLKLQKVTNITLSDIKKHTSEYVSVYDMLFSKQDPVENYRQLGEMKNKVDEVLNSFGCDFIDYIINNKPQFVSYIPTITITVARYQQQRTSVIDPFVSLLACVYEIQGLLGNDGLV